jgi:predicted transcriptional regulator
MSQTLLEMAKDLVQAQIQVHSLAPEGMHGLLHDIHTCLVALHVQEASPGLGAVAIPETTPVPINWRKSITKQTVTCLECGASFKQLSAHLKAHGLDCRTYRERYRIPPRQPLAARALTAHRKQIVQQSRPWEKAPTYVKAQEKIEKQVQLPAVKKTRVSKSPESATAGVVGPPKRVTRKKTPSKGEGHG